jgi:hypothetical protein
MGIEPTAGGCPATGFEVQERHQAANYSRVKNFKAGSRIDNLKEKLNFTTIDYTIWGLFVKIIIFSAQFRIRL